MNILKLRNVTVAAVVLPMLVFAAGCATYANVPAQAGDVASNNPDRGNVVNVQAAALRAIIEAGPLPSPVTIRLAPGTTPDSYAQALTRIGDAVVKHEGEGLPVLDVHRVLIRGWVAQSDIVREAGAAPGESSAQLITTYLRWRPFTGWFVDRMRTWRMPVEEALIQSRREAEISISQ